VSGPTAADVVALVAGALARHVGAGALAAELAEAAAREVGELVTRRIAGEPLDAILASVERATPVDLGAVKGRVLAGL
jgi:hypothetical protein